MLKGGPLQVGRDRFINALPKREGINIQSFQLQVQASSAFVHQMSYYRRYDCLKMRPDLCVVTQRVLFRFLFYWNTQIIDWNAYYSVTSSLFLCVSALVLFTFILTVFHPLPLFQLSSSTNVFYHKRLPIPHTGFSVTPFWTTLCFQSHSIIFFLKTSTTIYFSVHLSSE